MTDAALPGALTDYSWTPGRLARVVVHVASAAVLVAGFGWSRELAVYLVLGVCLTEAALVDLETLRLPNRLLLVPFVIGAIVLAAIDGAGSDGSIGRAAAASALGFVGLLLLHLLYPAGMGLGDVKLAAVMGLYLGWLSWAAFGLALLAAVVLSGLVSGYLIRRDPEGSPAVPMGPFLVAATVVSAAIHAV